MGSWKSRARSTGKASGVRAASRRFWRRKGSQKGKGNVPRLLRTREVRLDEAWWQPDVEMWRWLKTWQRVSGGLARLPSDRRGVIGSSDMETEQVCSGAGKTRGSRVWGGLLLLWVLQVILYSQEEKA